MDRFKTDTYMRRHFDKILDDYGHYIYLQRDISDNTSEKNDEGQWVVEIHKVRFSIGTTRGLSDAKQEASEGILSSSDRIYHFRYDAQPFENDKIYEIEPARSSLPPTKISLAADIPHAQLVFVIDVVVPMYGVGGNLVYWQAGSTRIRPN